MPGAYNGKLLRVDLTTGTTTVETVSDLTNRLYLGGGTMAAYLLARELKPGVDPLGPDNVLIFTTCPTNASPISGTNRFSAAAKSPLSGGYGEEELQKATAFRVYEDPADLLRHIDELGGRR